VVIIGKLLFIFLFLVLGFSLLHFTSENAIILFGEKRPTHFFSHLLEPLFKQIRIVQPLLLLLHFLFLCLLFFLLFLCLGLFHSDLLLYCLVHISAFCTIWPTAFSWAVFQQESSKFNVLELRCYMERCSTLEIVSVWICILFNENGTTLYWVDLGGPMQGSSTIIRRLVENSNAFPDQILEQWRVIPHHYIMYHCVALLTEFELERT